MIQKVPPHNLEAEEAVLGSIFIDPGVVNDVMEILKSDDFYLKKHQLIFSAIEKLYDAAEPIDVLSVCEQLKQSKKMAAIGTELEVARLAESVPTSAHALHYAQIVRDKSILRSLISTASDIVESAYGEEEVDEILDRAEKQVFEIAESRASKTYQHIGAIMHNIFEKLESVRENPSSVAEPGAFVTGIPTGLKSLDKQTTGFHEADLVIVAARPSVGKTALALTIARNMAIRFNIGVGLFSLEMSKEQLAHRLLCAESFVDLHKLRTGFLSEEDWKKLTAGASILYKANLIVDDEPSLDPRTLRAKVRRMKREYGVSVVFVDYLQLMHVKRSSESRQQEISEISRSLKLLARELNITIVALSQLSRAVEQREDKRPRLSDLRESGAIEQDADTVIFIYRDEYYQRTEKLYEPHEAEVIIGKQRNGPVGTVKLMFNPKSASFFEQDSIREV